MSRVTITPTLSCESYGIMFDGKTATRKSTFVEAQAFAAQLERFIAENPEAQVEEHFYGHGHRREWHIAPAPWKQPIAKADSPNEAWEIAVKPLR